MLFSHDAIAADGLTFSEKSREPTKTLNFRLFPSSADRKVRLHPIVPVNSPIYKQLQNNIQQQQVGGEKIFILWNKFDKNLSNNSFHCIKLSFFSTFKNF